MQTLSEGGEQRDEAEEPTQDTSFTLQTLQGAVLIPDKLILQKTSVSPAHSPQGSLEVVDDLSMLLHRCTNERVPVFCWVV